MHLFCKNLNKLLKNSDNNNKARARHLSKRKKRLKKNKKLRKLIRKEKNRRKLIKTGVNKVKRDCNFILENEKKIVKKRDPTGIVIPTGSNKSSVNL